MAGNKHNNKKLQKVLLELKFLYADLEYHEEVMADALQEFQAAFLKKAKEEGVILPKTEEEASAPNNDTELGFQSNIDDQNETEDLEVPSEEEPKDDREETEFQNLFRKITKLTHPDLYPSDSEAKKKEKIDKFIKAKKAVVNKNWFELYSIAIDLGVELPTLSAIHIKWMDEEVKKVKKAVQKIKGSLVWNWYHDEAKREKYMDSYIKQFNKAN